MVHSLKSLTSFFPAGTWLPQNTKKYFTAEAKIAKIKNNSASLPHQLNSLSAYQLNFTGMMSVLS
jgi:hypothetical protein